MRKWVCVLSLSMVLLIASLATADTVSINRVNGYYTGNGGEFSLLVNNNNLSPDLNWVLPLYNSLAKGKWGENSFQSFCVEMDEYVNAPGGPYNFAINNQAIAGGVNTNSGDPLSVGTAYLYYKFATGQLSNYDYLPPGRDTSAGLLQTAIWWLEDEITLSNPLSNYYINYLINTVGMANPKADNNGQYPVAILNLYGASRELKQDQLVLVPEPATMLLLGSGLLGLAGFVRRRFRK